MVECYRYLGQEVRVDPTLLRSLAVRQLSRFTQAAGCLRGKVRQLGALGPGLRCLLANSLCTSHLLIGAVIWGSELPAVPTVRPPTYDSPAASMQRAFSALLCWALQVPRDTRLELLHLLANQPPVGTLVAKQLVRYAESLERELATAESQALGHRPLRHAHLVWRAIQ